MNQIRFERGYKYNNTLRKSYSELSNLTFGIEFEEYYQMGYWSDRYLPFSYVYQDKVIANVSVNLLDFVIQGQKKKALQIGTVMTHPDFQKRGLSTSLMNKVLAEYSDAYDFMYLFANKDVLDFYPKFGFKTSNEHIFFMNFAVNKKQNRNLRKLDIANIKDKKFIYEFVSDRIPVSETFSTLHSEGIFMFYCLNVFPQNIYYLAEEDVIVVFKQEQKILHLYDIVSKKEIEIEPILTKISDLSTEKVIFHYTPAYKNLQIESKPFIGYEVLFVKPFRNSSFPPNIKHPLMSQA
ncbi:GNAT family N-acetyltransferase [Priestia megaterium]|uniref:GNAT family N-acetyltransferase n=1 Tax=Priestia megaterium TaxID=1404 RepID=A0ABD4WMT2_PRIMG|nr:GNAT family N-acetyltransferase [Priestia megaterium]MDD9781539.1 GNAT family N-acetyltransferase [Priestia megaterium]MED3816041.1 GNAT family N-acetyltransferase [Priestia megaterium]